MVRREPSLGPMAVAFGPFCLIPDRGLLLRGETECRLGSRALDILVCLVERAGETVTKQELLSRAWPNTFVHEANLRVHIAALRKALGDGQAGARYLVNVMGRGYCFVAPVTPIEPAVPAASSECGPRTNLPAPLSQMLGRDAAVAAVALQVPARRCVTLAGPGGIGKTRVALAAAERLLPVYDDGVWFVDLSLLAEGAPVAPTVAAVLGISTNMADPLPGIIAFLRDRRLLLVLDNCEHVVEAAAALAEAVLGGAPGVAVLATSREPLRVAAEWVHWLPPMAVPPETEGLTAARALGFAAVQLFVECAAASLEGFSLDDAEAPVVASICRNLDGLPLAIELVAARVDLFGVRGLARVLDDPFLLLTEGRRGAMPRQQNLLRTLEWSYRLLSPVEQRILRRLAVFRGEFTLEGALAVAAADGVTPEQVYSGVLTLSAKSLIVTDISGESPRDQHRLLHVARSFVSQKPGDTAEMSRVRRRHAEHLHALLTEADRDWTRLERAGWLAIYGRTIGDVRAAIDWAFSPEGEVSLGVVLTALAMPLGFQLSLVHEFRLRVERALLHTRSLEPPQLLAEMRLNITLCNLVHNTAGPLPGRAACIARALEIAPQLANPVHRAEPLIGWATAQLGTGDYAAARDLATEALDIAQGAGDGEAVLAAERLLAQVLHFDGDHAGAEARALHVLDHSAAQLPLAYSLMPVNRHVTLRVILARIAWLRGEWRRAGQLVQELLDHARRDAAYSICPALVFGAIPIAIWNGDDQAALALTATLAENATRYTLGYWQGWAAAFGRLLALRAGDADAARDLSENLLSGPAQLESFATFSAALITPAIAMRAEAGAGGWCRAEIRRAQGAWMIAQGAPDSERMAEKLFREALGIAREQGAVSWALRASVSLARLLRRRDRAPEARDLIAAMLRDVDAGFPSADVGAALALLHELDGPGLPVAATRRRPARRAVPSSGSAARRRP